MENGKLVKGMRTFFFIDWMANFKWQFFFSNFTLIAKVEKKIKVSKTREKIKGKVSLAQTTDESGVGGGCLVFLCCCEN